MIVGFYNPLNGRKYGLDDLEAFQYMMPEAVLKAMIRKEKVDERHSGTNITITMGMGCPREALIHRMLDTYPDPQKMWAMHKGTWLHEQIGMAQGEIEEWWTEETAPEHCVYVGELAGIKMGCKVDALRKDYSVLMDWKFRKDGAEKFIDSDRTAKVEDACQLNMARMLMEQTLKRSLDEMKMYVWVMAGEAVRTEVPHMTIEQILRVKPGGGEHDINTIFKLLSVAMQRWQDEAGEADIFQLPDAQRKVIINDLPMVGQTMYKNRKNPQLNKCTSYCAVKHECFDLMGGI